jgi:hypothetical protein
MREDCSESDAFYTPSIYLEASCSSAGVLERVGRVAFYGSRE